MQPKPHKTRHLQLFFKFHLNSNFITFENGTDPPDRDGALSVELAQYELHVEEREGPQGQHQDVRDEEGAAAILVTQVGEPPHVGEVHGEPDDAEEEVEVAAPGLSVPVLALINFEDHFLLHWIEC